MLTHKSKTKFFGALTEGQNSRYRSARSRRKKVLSALLCLLCALLLAACLGKTSPLDKAHPVTLNMWHNFGGDMQKTMDQLIDEFNRTLGRDHGIIVNVTAISSSAELGKALDMILEDSPGASELPDLFTAYPKTAVRFERKGKLAKLDEYFTKEELEAYVAPFVEEGRLEDGGLYVFPIAKSTEVLYLNQTLFDRFAAACDCGIERLSSFEGIAQTAIEYYDWTDAMTPDIPNDGKSFFCADSWLNFAQSGMQQLGSSLFVNQALDLHQSEYKQIWASCFSPAAHGAYAIFDGYSSDLSKTGDIVCSLGSSAGVLFYGDQITYPDNRTEQVTYRVLPYPLFSGGEKVAIQRGNGLCVAKSGPQKEYAAALFLKWFTAAQQNLKFIASTGYLPVTKQAFEEGLNKKMEEITNPRVRDLLLTASEMYKDYRFYVPPVFENFDKLCKLYEQTFRQGLLDSRQKFLNHTASVDELSRDTFAAFEQNLR